MGSQIESVWLKMHEHITRTYCVFWINNCSGIKLDEICVGAPQCGSRVHVQSLPERDGDNVM